MNYVKLINRYWRQLAAIYALPKQCWAELVRRMMAENYGARETLLLRRF
jgi:hypothetical protein